MLCFMTKESKQPHTLYNNTQSKTIIVAELWCDLNYLNSISSSSCRYMYTDLFKKLVVSSGIWAVEVRNCSQDIIIVPMLYRTQHCSVFIIDFYVYSKCLSIRRCCYPVYNGSDVELAGLDIYSRIKAMLVDQTLTCGNKRKLLRNDRDRKTIQTTFETNI